MKKDTIINFVLLISILLGGCSSAQVENIPKPEEDAVIAPLGFGATMTGINQALQSAPGTFILESEKAVIFAWPSGSNYAFAGFSKLGGILKAEDIRAMCGQSCATLRMAELYRTAVSNGWREITPDKLPYALLTVLQGWISVVGDFASRALPTIPVIILPVLPGDIFGAPLADS